MESLFNDSKRDVFIYSSIPKIELVKGVNNVCLSSVPRKITWPMGHSWRNYFSIALIFFSSRVIDHTSGAEIFSRPLAPTFHETAELAGRTDTMQAQVTSVWKEACMQGVTYSMRASSLIWKLNKEASQKRCPLNWKRKLWESGRSPKFHHEKLLHVSIYWLPRYFWTTCHFQGTTEGLKNLQRVIISSEYFSPI